MNKEAEKNLQEKEMVPKIKVVVTGLGMVTPLGLNAETTWNNLIAGKSGISAINIPGTQVKVAGVVEGFDVKTVLGGFVELKDLKRISRAAQFSLAAAIEACKDAGLLDNNNEFQSGIDPTRVGITIGTGFGGAGHLAEISEKLKTGKKLSPFDSLLIEPERVASVPSMKLGAKGPVEMISAACASGNRAITDGYKDIYVGQADVMIVGGTDSTLGPALLETFYATGALANETDPEEASRANRPFDKTRKGFVMSEGAGIIILEEREHAKRRGARILAEMVGYGNTADAGSDTDPSGEGAERAIKMAIKMSGGFPDEGLIYVNAHGTGTQKDSVEIKAIRTAIVEQYNNTVISSTKGATGHLLGAAGAVGTIFGIETMREGVLPILPPTINLNDPMDETEGINLIPNISRLGMPVRVIINSFGFGGINSVTLFKRRE